MIVDVKNWRERWRVVKNWRRERRNTKRELRRNRKAVSRATWKEQISQAVQTYRVPIRIEGVNVIVDGKNEDGNVMGIYDVS